MSTFTKTAQNEQQFAAFVDKIDKISEKLSPYSDIAKISELQNIREEFLRVTNDFFSENRKLNIGVVGQVKAGKSSFLNTLLFDGKKVLPSAVTPKTATLTKIEYSPENKLCIEYYTESEWKELEENARAELSENKFEAAREIIMLAKEKGIIPAEYIAKGTDEFLFSSPDELMDKLDDYVGESGIYTAVVKNVSIKLNKEELKEITVVDTPGLNDPVASRTDKTRKFISYCDVVFFLNHASHCLDESDLTFLTSKLPQKDVKKIVMIYSRFDDGMLDELYNYDSIKTTIANVQKSLKSRAVSVVKEQLKSKPHLESILSPCKDPIFVSSMCYNMSKKDANDYDENEKHTFDNLNVYDDLDNEILREIGNIDYVRSVFDEVVAEKDKTLSAKAEGFIPTAQAQLKAKLTEMRQFAEKTLNILNTSDKAELEKQKKAMAAQIYGIKGSIEGVFGELITKMETAKGKTLRLIREASADAAKLNTKEGVETHVSKHTVSDAKWYNPFSWGKSHTEYSSYETRYSYLDAADAIENIRVFSAEACTDIENTFYSTVEFAETKRRLLNVVVENFDTSSDVYDPAFFKLITEQTLNEIKFPIIKLDISNEQNALSSQFAGEVRDSGERSKLMKLLSEVVDKLLTVISDRLESETASFRSEIEALKNGFSEKLLANIEEDFNKLLAQFENKEREIAAYDNFLTLLKTVE